MMSGTMIMNEESKLLRFSKAICTYFLNIYHYKNDYCAHYKSFIHFHTDSSMLSQKIIFLCCVYFLRLGKKLIGTQIYTLAMDSDCNAKGHDTSWTLDSKVTLHMQTLKRFPIVKFIPVL